jgi:AraC-like DNA-binding protein
MRTRNLDEAIEAVTEVYCPHTLKVMGKVRGIDARLEIANLTFQPLVQLSYDAPVEIDAGDFANLFLMMGCARGSASCVQENQSAEWRQGQTMPFSANHDTRLRFDRRFAQEAVRLDTGKLEAQCRRWLGRPLERRLRFALHPFSDELEQIWQRSIAYQRSLEESRLVLSPPAKAAFDEFLLTLVLHHHPHTFSEELAEEAPAPVPGLVRRAERFMADNAEASITVSDVAEHLGVSLRTLQAGFRCWRNSTPSAFLRQARLRRVRDDLLRADGATNVTAVALQYGFAHLGRFSAYYQSAFGETPSATLRRGRAGLRR